MIIMEYFAYKTRFFFLSDFKDIGFWQLLVKKNVKFFVGYPPLAPSNEGNQEKLPSNDCLWPPIFFLKSLHTIKMRMFTKNQTKKYPFSDEWQYFCAINIFFLWRATIFFKISYPPQFWKFLSKLLHVVSIFTYQQSTSYYRMPRNTLAT